jgi:hypothetical protein
VLTRAREQVANGGRTSANPTELRRLLDAIVAAAQSGDVAGLENALWVGRSGGPRLCSRRAASAPGRSHGRLRGGGLSTHASAGVSPRVPGRCRLAHPLGTS